MVLTYRSNMALMKSVGGNIKLFDIHHLFFSHNNHHKQPLIVHKSKLVDLNVQGK